MTIGETETEASRGAAYTRLIEEYADLVERPFTVGDLIDGAADAERGRRVAAAAAEGGRSKSAAMRPELRARNRKMAAAFKGVRGTSARSDTEWMIQIGASYGLRRSAAKNAIRRGLAELEKEASVAATVAKDSAKL